MPQSVYVGAAEITVADTQFLNGFQAGRFHDRTLFKGKPLTDQEMYNLIAQAVSDVQMSDRVNAGYITGFIRAMHELAPQEQRARVTVAMLETEEVSYAR